VPKFKARVGRWRLGGFCWQNGWAAGPGVLARHLLAGALSYQLLGHHPIATLLSPRYSVNFSTAMSQLGRCGIVLRHGSCKTSVPAQICRNGFSRFYATTQPSAANLGAANPKQNELRDAWTKCRPIPKPYGCIKLTIFNRQRLQFVDTIRSRCDDRLPWKAAQCWKAPFFC
jgi:hypothetical protein